MTDLRRTKIAVCGADHCIIARIVLFPLPFNPYETLGQIFFFIKICFIIDFAICSDFFFIIKISNEIPEDEISARD